MYGAIEQIEPTNMTQKTKGFFLNSTAILPKCRHLKRGRRDLNPQPPDRQSDDPDPEDTENIDFMQPESPACTSACTSEANSVNADGVEADQVDPLKAIAAAISNLSPEDRAQLSTTLSDREEEGTR